MTKGDIMELNAKLNFIDTFKHVQAQKQTVEIYLVGGHSFTGKVLDVADHYVIIGHLQGKEFYDAQIRVEDISAISIQTRGINR